MSSIRPQDRAFLCSFTFADGRRCRTPLSSRHPRLCFDHARKEAQTNAPDQVGSDLSIFLSGDYVSAHDLSAAIARLLLDVAHGQIKRKTASTLACLSRILLHSIQLSQHEFIREAGVARLPRPSRRPKISAKRASH
jgi:hypothetical protein